MKRPIRSANAAEPDKNSAPVKLIITEERTGIFIPAAPMPAAAANPSVQTAAVRRRILSIVNHFPKVFSLTVYEKIEKM